MAAAFSDRFSDATRQLAAAATRANRLALENAESMFGVQLKAMERNLTATGGWLVNWPAATTRPGCSTGAHSRGRTTCSGWARPSRMWSVSACRPARPGPNWCRVTTNQRRTRTVTDATQRSLHGSLPMQSGPGRSLPLPGLFARCLDSRALPRLDFLRADGPRRRAGLGNVPGAGRGPSPPPLLCPGPCPPRRGSACGGQGIEQAVSNKAPIDFERRAETLAYEVKGEVTANGRRRRTFVRKGLRPAPRRMNPPHACLRFDSPRIEGPRRGRQGPG